MTRTNYVPLSLLFIVLLFGGNASGGNPAQGDGETVTIWVATESQSFAASTVDVYHGKLIGIYALVSCDSLTIQWGMGGVNAACFDETTPTAQPGDVNTYTVTATASWPQGSGKNPIVATMELRVLPWVDITAVTIVGVTETRAMQADYSPEPDENYTIWWSCDDDPALGTLTDTDQESAKITGDDEGTAHIEVHYYNVTTGLEGSDTQDVEVTECYVKNFKCSCTHGDRQDVIVARDGTFQVAFCAPTNDTVTVTVAPSDLTKFCTVPEHCYWEGIGRQLSITKTAPDLGSFSLLLFNYEPTSDTYKVNDCRGQGQNVEITIESYPADENVLDDNVFVLAKQIRDFKKPTWGKTGLAKYLKYDFNLCFAGSEKYEESSSWEVEYKAKVGIEGNASLEISGDLPIPLTPVPPWVMQGKIGASLKGTASMMLYASKTGLGNPWELGGEAGFKVVFKVYGRLEAGTIPGCNPFAYAELGAETGGSYAGPFQAGGALGITWVPALKVGGLTISAEVGAAWGIFKRRREFVVFEPFYESPPSPKAFPSE